MSERRPVAVVVNDGTDAEQLEAFQRACSFPCVVFPVKDSTALQSVVRRIYAAGPAEFEAVVNLCADELDSPDGVTAALASVFLDQCSLPYTGCRAKALNYSFDIVLMMLYYAEVPLPPFAIIDGEAAARRAAAALQAPVHIRSACAVLGLYEETCAVQASVEDALLRAFHAHGKVVAWQVSPSTECAMHVLVAGGSVKGAVAVVPVQPTSQPPSWWKDGEAAARQYGAAVSRFVLYDCGIASLTLNTLSSEPDRWCFQNVVLNPPVAQLLTLTDAAVNLLDAAPSRPELLTSLVAEAKSRHPDPTFAIKLHSDSRKGYHLCAAKAIKKDEIVFEDECRNFAIVTRPHVEQHWDARSKKVFTEYAWPLDSDGHLYAIWEEDPRRWRPINHSCDPNCFFAAPHSLNVIAARDIAAGEDLSMDYATFCDGTMKPFQCLCGAACCRGLIRPDAASLAKYGENSWLRKVPPPTRPLLPSETQNVEG
ncbi:putative SET domain protein [Leptomonas pyrrhocoris]|uniref:Putative SET domain protein n=1 Tax=Leptomonas pyrrhocoris TaxID=157538 RepID=A0A0N0DV47_LEPPY|nr:putative SET domain protein [Leptomonas pyrrhocoris]XP_015658281.1 putative SET domain protein [Leptomonas pyrrhocoris]KPA79841.1 putative SET domain protein [Leptomonas pyrrhocoris]KPA79842.1 putative SET domain protein [Leptomonas pyrrhocoris]|eukprot:XP_015658280.1 putative SET domain protein [Leptomonas pyrrhocoris]